MNMITKMSGRAKTEFLLYCFSKKSFKILLSTLPFGLLFKIGFVCRQEPVLGESFVVNHLKT